MARKSSQHGKTRHKDGTQETRGKISNSIELRPEEVTNCCGIWYWEDDTVVYKTMAFFISKLASIISEKYNMCNSSINNVC